MSESPQPGDRIEYRITGGGARQINATSDTPLVVAGDWVQLEVTDSRSHSSRDEQIVIGKLRIGANVYHQVEATLGEGFGSWRWPAEVAEA